MNDDTEQIVLEIKLPVPVKELAAISDALGGIHGKDKLFMRQAGPMLQIFKLKPFQLKPGKKFKPGEHETR